MSFSDIIKNQRFLEEKNFFNTIEIESPEVKKLPVALLLDTSSSMDINISTLAKAYNSFIDTIKDNDDLNLSVELTVITFDSKATIKVPFSPINRVEHLSIKADGTTAMHEAIHLGIQEVESRKAKYRGNTDYSRPLIFLITDGAPTDMNLGCQKYTELRKKLEDGERKSSFAFFAIGVDGADFGFLNSLSPNRPALELVNADFQKLFIWLQNSMEAIIETNISEEVSLPDPTSGALAWAKFRI